MSSPTASPIVIASRCHSLDDRHRLLTEPQFENRKVVDERLIALDSTAD